eukprot:Tbor_TRINITY_DN9899_c0_g1::TRINITY_DN9899_c0_g1_i1::g.11931::m.11931
MIESSYLKEDLGPVIAKGLAEVCIARPQDPQQFLGLWLLHYVQQRQRKADEVSIRAKLESEREEWRKGRGVRERIAASAIQREWRAHLCRGEEHRREEAALRQLFADVEDEAAEGSDEEISYGSAVDGDNITDEERDLEADRSTNYIAYKRGRLFVNVLEKNHIGALKSIVPDSNISATRVLRCCMYLQGYKANKVNTLDKIKHLIKPFKFVTWMRTYDPLHGNPPTMKSATSRARRILTRVDEDEVKSCSAALHAIFTWMRAAVLYRDRRDAHIKYRLRQGRDTGDDVLEEGEDIEEGDGNDAEPLPIDDIDIDDEEVKVEEEEVRRQVKAEAERAAAEEVEEDE